MVNLSIKFATETIIVFAVGDEVYYLQLVPGAHYLLYNSRLKRQIIYNFDDWVQVNTQQRYGFRTLLDMAAAFRQGLAAAYSGAELHACFERLTQQLLLTLFTSEFAIQYKNAYLIELQDHVAFDKLLSRIRDNFDTLKNDPEFHNYMRRMLHYCNINQHSAKPTIERLFERLGLSLDEPHYTSTVNLNHDLLKKTLDKLKLPSFQVDQDILEKIDAIQSGRV